MSEIRILELSEIKCLHHERMQEDFPPMELRPYRSMEDLHKKGCYVGLAYEREGRQTAYACFYHTPEGTCQLLDLFAVYPELRGQGIGSEFLRDLRSHLGEADGVFIEAESPETAKTEEEKKTRQRRIAFYQKNGAIRTGLRCLLFHVDYEILFLPSQKTSVSVSEGDVATQEESRKLYRQLEQLYRTLYGKVYGRLCRLSFADKMNGVDSD